MPDLNEVGLLRAEIDAQNMEIDLLKESLSTRSLELENIGWTTISGYEQSDDGLTLENIHKLSLKLRELAASNPWHIRGAQLRHSYVFGKGMSFVDLKPKAQKVIDDVHNKSVLFSVDAYETNNLSLFTDGNLIISREQASNRFMAIPMSQIKGVVTDPDDTSYIRYVKRVWNPNNKEREEWFPVARFKRETPGKVQKSITNLGKTVPVSKTHVVYIKQSKKQTGWTWGVPDSLGAYIWTLAYSGYLQDNSKLVHALSKFAWTLTKQTEKGTQNAATQVVQPGVGGTAIMGAGNQMASVGVPSAQVNMNNGQPLIAAVAASFGVPVIALLSSPGATGGSYGAASTLDQPTLKGFEASQDSWIAFYKEILLDLGSPNAAPEFPSIESDLPYRQITSINTSVELGIIHRDEARVATLDILDVPKLHDELPPEPVVKGSVVSGQGDPADGVVGATTNPGSDTNHDNDE